MDTEAGSEAHYEDAEHYERTYRRRKEDVRFYAHLAKKCGGPVLELGCGTGRVTRAIADRGIEIVGVDRMTSMLDVARERVAKPKRVREKVELEQGDLRTLALERRFPLVISPFNVFMHLYERTEVEEALAVVLKHLAPGGQFIFDVRMPNARELARDPDKIYKGRGVKRSDGRKYHYRERFDYDPVTQVQQIDLAYVGVDDPSNFVLTPLTHRQFFPQELEALLHYNGFRVVHHYGDFEFEELDWHHESQVLVCEAR